MFTGEHRNNWDDLLQAVMMAYRYSVHESFGNGLLIGNTKGGCAYRFTTYRDYNYAIQDGLFGVQVHHPRFLEWVGLRNTPAY